MKTNPSTFLTKEEQAQVVNAIAAAELLTTGEIRVHLESRCKGDAIERAAALFHQLKMDETLEHNAALIYIAYQSRHFAVVCDTGINAVIPPDSWKSVTDKLSASFALKDFCGGICRAIFTVGSKMARHFPFKAGDTNELLNDISFGE